MQEGYLPHDHKAAEGLLACCGIKHFARFEEVFNFPSGRGKPIHRKGRQEEKSKRKMEAEPPVISLSRSARMQLEREEELLEDENLYFS